MTDIPHDASPQEAFDLAANDTDLWVTKAEALLTSSDLLRKEFTEVPEEDFDAYWEFFKLFTVAQMLRGMAVECLLKGIWLVRVGALAADGRFHAIPETKDHDLLSMTNALNKRLDLGLSKEETELLAVLSFAITSGRYPVSKTFNKRPCKPDWVTKMRWCKWSIPVDDKWFASLLSKLQGHLNKTSPGWERDRRDH